MFGLFRKKKKLELSEDTINQISEETRINKLRQYRKRLLSTPYGKLNEKESKLVFGYKVRGNRW